MTPTEASRALLCAVNLTHMARDRHAEAEDYRRQGFPDIAAEVDADVAHLHRQAAKHAAWARSSFPQHNEVSR